MMELIIASTKDENYLLRMKQTSQIPIYFNALFCCNFSLLIIIYYIAFPYQVSALPLTQQVRKKQECFAVCNRKSNKNMLIPVCRNMHYCNATCRCNVKA